MRRFSQLAHSAGSGSNSVQQPKRRIKSLNSKISMLNTHLKSYLHELIPQLRINQVSKLRLAKNPVIACAGFNYEQKQGSQRQQFPIEQGLKNNNTPKNIKPQEQHKFSHHPTDVTTETSLKNNSGSAIDTLQPPQPTIAEISAIEFVEEAPSKDLLTIEQALIFRPIRQASIQKLIPSLKLESSSNSRLATERHNSDRVLMDNWFSKASNSQGSNEPKQRSRSKFNEPKFIDVFKSFEEKRNTRQLREKNCLPSTPKHISEKIPASEIHGFGTPASASKSKRLYTRLDDETKESSSQIINYDQKLKNNRSLKKVSRINKYMNTECSRKYRLRDEENQAPSLRQSPLPPLPLLNLA